MHCGQGSASKFSLKLLMGQRVVLVEHPGLEPQLFAPILRDDGVTLEKVTIDMSSERTPGLVPNEVPSHMLNSNTDDSSRNNQVNSSADLAPPVDVAMDPLEQRKRVRFQLAHKHKNLETKPKNLEPSRECVVHGRTVKNLSIRHVPPPFDVIYKIFYLDRES